MSKASGYHCTLTPEQLGRRAIREEPLRQGLLAYDRHGREVRLRFGADLLDHVHTFVRDESACCSFFDFVVTPHDDDVELTVRAPSGAEPMLDALIDAFDDRGAP